MGCGVYACMSLTLPQVAALLLLGQELQLQLSPQWHSSPAARQGSQKSVTVTTSPYSCRKLYQKQQATVPEAQQARKWAFETGHGVLYR